VDVFRCHRGALVAYLDEDERLDYPKEMITHVHDYSLYPGSRLR
jgi:hypothetical protein